MQEFLLCKISKENVNHKDAIDMDGMPFNIHTRRRAEASGTTSKGSGRFLAGTGDEMLGLARAREQSTCLGTF